MMCFVLAMSLVPKILGLAPPKLSNLPFIKDKDLPICKDCKHFILYKPEDVQNIFTYRLGHCALFGRKDYVSGYISYEYADHCRINNEQCSMEGLLYEPKNGPTELLP